MTSHDRRIRSMQKNSTKRVGEKLVQCLRAAPLPRRFHYSSSSLGERTTVLPFFFPSDWKEKILEGIRERWSASLRGVSTVLSSMASPCSLHGLLTESGSRHCFTAESPEHNSAPLYSRSRSFSFFFLFVARIFSLFFCLSDPSVSSVCDSWYSCGLENVLLLLKKSGVECLGPCDCWSIHEIYLWNWNSRNLPYRTFATLRIANLSNFVS